MTELSFFFVSFSKSFDYGTTRSCESKFHFSETIFSVEIAQQILFAKEKSSSGSLSSIIANIPSQGKTTCLAQTKNEWKTVPITRKWKRKRKNTWQLAFERELKSAVIFPRIAHSLTISSTFFSRGLGCELTKKKDQKKWSFLLASGSKITVLCSKNQNRVWVPNENQLLLFFTKKLVIIN